MRNERKVDNDRRTADDRWLSVNAAVEYSGYSRSTLYRLMGRRVLQYSRVGPGRQRRIRKSDIDALYERADASL